MTLLWYVIESIMTVALPLSAGSIFPNKPFCVRQKTQ